MTAHLLACGHIRPQLGGKDCSIYLIGCESAGTATAHCQTRHAKYNIPPALCTDYLD